MKYNQHKLLERKTGRWLLLMLAAVILAQLWLGEQGLLDEEYKRFDRFVSWSD